MKKILFAFGASALLLASCNQEPEGPVPAYDINTLEFETEDEELSYCMGVSVANSLIKDSTLSDIIVDEIAEGCQDMVSNNDFKYDKMAIQKIQMGFQKMKPADVKSLGDTMSYAVGLNVGQGFAQSGMDFDQDLFHFGLTSIFEDFETIYDEKENDSVIRTIVMGVQQKRQAEEMAKAEENKIAGEEFLAKNGAREGVVTTESGLQIETIEAGKGKNPNGKNIVKVHYSGTTINGEKFDSSYDRGQPFETVVDGQIIQGWREALKLMQVGGKYKVYIPQNLAYGANPRPGGPIKPFAALIFDMELVEIVK